MLNAHVKEGSMKKMIFALLIVFAFGCSEGVTEKEKVKTIIYNSNYGALSLKKIKDLNILKDDLFYFPAHSLMIDGYNTNDENEYLLARYIFKTDIGVGRMFYLIDFTNNSIIDKSSVSNDFYLPISEKIFGNNSYDIEGENLMYLMRN
jgi:hypothetical protein